MPIPVTPSVFEALGRSFVGEEGLGDFRLARQLAQSAAAVANTPADRFETLLTLGIVHMLRGQLRLAFRCWDLAETIDHQAAGRELLLATFRHLATYERWNTKLDGSAPGAVEINARWNVQQTMELAIPQLNALRNACKVQEIRDLAWYLGEVYGVSKNLRSTVKQWQTGVLSSDDNAIIQKSMTNLSDTAERAVRQQLTDYSVLPEWLRADMLHRAGLHDQAIAALDKAEYIARKQKDRARVGRCRVTRGDWLSASFSTPMSWDLAAMDSAMENSNLAGSIEAFEYSPVDEQALAEAEKFYRIARRKFEVVDAKRSIAQVCIRRAYLHGRRDKWTLALKWLKKAERLFRQTEDYRGVMLTRTHRLMVKLWIQDWDRIKEVAGVIGRWGRWSGDFSYIYSLGLLLNRFARHLFLRHGRFEAARQAYQTARALFLALDAPINAVQNTVDLALLNEAIGDFTTAAPELRAAADEFIRLAGQPPPGWLHPESVTPFLYQHAIMLISKGYNISNGLMDWEQMLAFMRQMDGLLKTLNPSGVLPAQPPTTLEEMRITYLSQYAAEVGQQASVLIPFYRFKHEEQENHQLAADQFWRAALQATDDLPEKNNLFYQAILWGSKREFAKASDSYRKYLQLEEAQLPPLPETDRLAVEFVAEEEIERVRHLHFWEQTFNMWVKLQQYEEAHGAWLRRCALEDEQWWERDHAPWKIGSTIAEIFEGLGDYDKAMEYCSRSLEQLDHRRNELSRDELKTAIANDRGAQFLYHQGARLAWRQEDPVGAFNFAERGKARALLDLLSAHPDRLSLKGQEQVEVQRWREYNAQLQAFRGLLAIERRRGNGDTERVDQLEKEIHSVSEQLSALEATLIREIPSFFSTIGGAGKTLTIGELQDYLLEDQLFIGYSYYDEDLFIWAVNRDGLVAASWQKLTIRALQYLATDLHRACQNKNDFRDPAGKLSRYLLEPLRQCLKDHSQLYIVPSGSLYLVPFQALPVDGIPLGKSHIISFLPSASSLPYFPEVRLKDSSKLLVVGNPTGDLNAAAAEASFIAHLFDTQALIGPAATEQAVRAAIPQAGILHLATHGHLSEEAPLASALALADDAQLSLYELMGMQLEADLVVLSACETGKGTTTNGDDVLGLTRGLLAAGARAAVVSFWSVDDTSTALFMKYFYQFLKEHGTPAQALAYAQNQLRTATRKMAAKDFDESFLTLAPEVQRSIRGIKLDRETETDNYHHPFYWAPFFYIGRL